MKPQLIGQKFNRLTVVAHINREKGYLCECECGNQTIAKGYALKSGRHRSCGCLQRELLAERARKPGFSALDNEIFKGYRRAAAKRGYDFSLTKEEFVNLIHSSCAYCGIEPATEWFGNKRKVIDTSSFRYNGVDRRDNSIGYTIENCVACCKVCNNSKSILSEEDWLSWLKRLVGFQAMRRFND